MIAINIEGEIKVFFEIPKKWNGMDNYDALSPEKHLEDGWKTLVVPNISETQKIGDLMEADDHITYEVLELTQDEMDALEEKKTNAIKAEIKSKYEFHKQNGWEFYQNFRAEIVVAIYGGDITEGDAFQIEAHLKDGFDKIANTGRLEDGSLHSESKNSIR